MSDLTQGRLMELLSYDEKSGSFVRRVSTNGRVKVGDTAGSLHHSGYLQIKVDGKNYSAHRLAWLYVYGAFPSNEIDHINGVKSDNRIANLREANHSQNLQNLRKARADSKSGLQGVSFDSRTNKFRGQILVNGKRMHLGYFDKAVDAHYEYLKAKAIFHPFQTVVESKHG